MEESFLSKRVSTVVPMKTDVDTDVNLICVIIQKISR